MKKLIALLLTAVSLTVILAGCSKGSAPTKPEDVKGETFEGGNISALVPEGWMAFHGTDYFDEYEEGYDPNVIQVCKGAKTEWDLLSKPYVMMTYFRQYQGIHPFGALQRPYYHQPALYLLGQSRYGPGRNGKLLTSPPPFRTMQRRLEQCRNERSSRMLQKIPATMIPGGC